MNKAVSNLNRNMSELCFSPIRRKVYIREEIEDLTTSRKLVNNIVIHQSYSNFGCEERKINATWTQTPMEVDDSDDHLNRRLCLKEKNEANESNRNDIPRIEKYGKNKKSRENSGKVYTRRVTILSAKTYRRLIFCLIIALCYFMTVSYPFVSVYKKLNSEGLRLELEQNVLGQRSAVADIVHNFEKVDSWMQKVKIMPFVGSNGVGKTFTANIVIKHFDRRVVFWITKFNFEVSHIQKSVLETITDTSLNLIVIDDLDISQLDSFFKFVIRLPKFDSKILVIPIFNIQERSKLDGTFKVKEDALRHIRNELDMSGFYFEVILFQTLDNNTLKNYVRNELVMRNIDTTKHDAIIDSFVQDKNIEYNGLKGISSRLSLFINKIKNFLSDH